MNEKTYERVIEYLKQQIQEGKLSCGSKIPSERELAASLNLGRNSVREALRTMEHTGMLESRQGKGNFLVNMPQKSLGNVFSMMLLTGQSNYREVSRIRRILEQEAFVQAVRLKNPEVLKRLKAEIKEMQIPEKTAEHDRRFHQELIRAGENQLLVAVMESLSGLCEEEIAHVQKEAKNEDWCQIHEEIVNALEEGNMETGYEYLKGLGNVVFQPETAGLLSAALLYESDGIGGERIQAEKTEPVSGTAHAKDRKIADHPEQNDSENTKQWTIRIDPADFPEENGTFPDRAADLKVLLRTYGQMLKESMPEIYEAGYTELVQKNQQVPEQPDTAPGDTSRERSTTPEFEDAFALYVLADRPMDAPGIWQECVRYFSQFGELNTYRSAVRNYLGLQTEE